MNLTKINPRGQITIPAKFREIKKMKKLMFRIMLLVVSVQIVLVIINVPTLLAEAVIPYKPAGEGVIPYKPAGEGVTLFKPAPKCPSLKEHLIFFMGHLLEHQFTPMSIDIIFQEPTVRRFFDFRKTNWGMNKEQVFFKI